MSTDIEKAEFHLRAEEYDKAEEIFSDIFESDSDSIQTIKGLIICKIAQSNFENAKIKAASVYLDKLDETELDTEEREEFIANLLEQIEEYFKKLNKKFREEANELTKRPALDGQLYAVKKLSDTTDYLDFLNNNANKFEEGIELAAKTYELTKYKEDTAYKIVSLHDLFFKSIRETPQMTGKTLLDANELSDLKKSREKWLKLSGENRSKVTADPSDSSGCLVLIFALTGLVGSVFLALFVLL